MTEAAELAFDFRQCRATVYITLCVHAMRVFDFLRLLNPLFDVLRVRNSIDLLYANIRKRKLFFSKCWTLRETSRPEVDFC